MTKARRVKQINVDPPIVYSSIKMAAEQVGVSEHKISYWLGRGYTPFGVFEALDPKNNGVTVKIDDKEYPSLSEAARCENFDRSDFTPKIRKGLKQFTIKGKNCVITDEYIP